MDILSVDTHGFEIVRDGALATHDLKTDESIGEYLHGIVDMLKRHLGSNTVVTHNYDVTSPFKFYQEARTHRFSFGGRKWIGPKSRRRGYMRRLHLRCIQVSPKSRGPQAVLTKIQDGTREGGPLRISRHLTREERDEYFDGSWRLRIVK